MTAGFVYVMRSAAVTWTKIGLSARAPHFRARELTADAVYGGIGPWEVVDYRQVADARATELALHRRFRGARVSHGSAIELFDVPPADAVAGLRDLAEADLVRGDLIGRLRLEPSLVGYLSGLFRSTGLGQFLDLQEAWTLTLFPSTNGGRNFTINVDRHEVAFSAPLPDGSHVFMLHMDGRVIDRRLLRPWLRARNGAIRKQSYASGMAGGVSVRWIGTMEDAAGVFDLPTIRRALVAYWYDSLLALRDRGGRSFFARFHDHNAVQELLRIG